MGKNDLKFGDYVLEFPDGITHKEISDAAAEVWRKYPVEICRDGKGSYWEAGDPIPKDAYAKKEKET